MAYQPKVYRKQGGAELVIVSGGQITAETGGKIQIETGGQIVPNSGTQASHIADVSVTTIAWTTGDKAKINTLLAALEGVGVLATS